MKTLLAKILPLFLLSSCVFDFPFETDAKIPVDSKLTGRWVEVPDKPDQKANQMLVIQHSANEYVVEYPVGDDAMFFRAFAVELEGAKYIQIQLIGSADKPVETSDRKYHLLKVGVDGDAMEMRTINPEVLGKDHASPAQMKAAFSQHKDDPKLFEEPAKFRRVTK